MAGPGLKLPPHRLTRWNAQAENHVTSCWHPPQGEVKAPAGSGIGKVVRIPCLSEERRKEKTASLKSSLLLGEKNVPGRLAGNEAAPDALHHRKIQPETHCHSERTRRRHMLLGEPLQQPLGSQLAVA